MPIFVDTSVLLYAFDQAGDGKREQARTWYRAIWATGHGRTSFQVLQEFYVNFATGASQTFITPSRGASHDSHWPSGESWAPERLGLPNSLLRSMSGAACSAAWAGIQAGDTVVDAVARRQDQNRNG